ncbi:HET-domain-containing protein [Daldinia vernicosa]|uniref:HET-domain-containing protein n=1 Tax=Daldinia vernicosa TaxID=114800 RepID=UPI002007C633|nr:HET-domain-containing protein [Daldinia vernicosa]KAI0846330.1 HET-domain-containing protein [Daldinia vernicosa]
MAIICLKCRGIGHKMLDCPTLKGHDNNSDPKMEPDHLATEPLAGGLASPVSQLCKRCKGFRIIDWLTNEDIRDEVVIGRDGANSQGWENKNHNSGRRLGLGPLHSIFLDASCSLCRMISRVFPLIPEDEEDWGAEYFIRPIRSYNRLGESIAPPEDSSKEPDDKYAVYAVVDSREDAMSTLSRHFGEPRDQAVYGFELAFALSHKTPAPSRPGFSARERGVTWQPDIVKSWMSRCEQKHPRCRVEWSDQLLICKMIDVSSRQIVSCPPHCRYIALSYVWGGVSPKDGALESRELPQTIEDAITVTKALGIGYLWVDALCIDQTPSPEKAQQLSMMDIIYSCSWATIVALDGNDANAGLRGVSAKSPREPQASESIDGSKVLSLFPALPQELTGTTYFTRAWTLQEYLLGSRRILFGKHQIHFLCNTGNYCESIDDTVDPGGLLDIGAKQANLILTDCTEHSEDLESQCDFADFTFRKLAGLYTNRTMTNDSDSLNAFRGMLSSLQKTFLPQGFIWGLPLKEFPQSMRWYHPRAVKPRRRPDFPSWSYVGWEGTIAYTDRLDFATGRTGGRFDEVADQILRYLGFEDTILTVDGVLIRLEVRNEPFNNAYIPGTDFLLGILQEGNFLHKNTLPQGTFDFLVVERLSFRYAPDSNVRHVVYMVMLEGELGSYSRRAMVRLFVEPGLDKQQDYSALFGRSRVVHLL